MCAKLGEDGGANVDLVWIMVVWARTRCDGRDGGDDMGYRWAVVQIHGDSRPVLGNNKGANVDLVQVTRVKVMMLMLVRSSSSSHDWFIRWWWCWVVLQIWFISVEEDEDVRCWERWRTWKRDGVGNDIFDISITCIKDTKLSPRLVYNNFLCFCVVFYCFICSIP